MVWSGGVVVATVGPATSRCWRLVLFSTHVAVVALALLWNHSLTDTDTKWTDELQ